MSKLSNILQIAIKAGAKVIHAKSLVSGHKNTEVIEFLKVTPKQLDAIVQDAFEAKLEEWISSQPTAAWKVEFPKFQDFSLEFQDPATIVYGPAWESSEKIVTELIAKRIQSTDQ